MLTASIVCPHCDKSDLATFTELHEFGVKEVVSEETGDLILKIEKNFTETAKYNLHPRRKTKGDDIYNELVPCACLLFCQNCFNPIMAVTELSRVDIANHVLYMKKISSGHKSSRLTMDRLTLFPEPKSPASHPSWPDRIQKLVPDIERILQHRLDPSIAISTERTVIDICMKDLGGDGRDIFNRINSLLEKGVITKPIADWAHKVRLLGRDATHDADGTLEEAHELLEFIKFFLRAAYELTYEASKLDSPTSEPM